MLQKCSNGAAKVRLSGTGFHRPILDLIIYVKQFVSLSLKWVPLVCSQLEQLTTSGVSPTALCEGQA